MAEMPPGTSVVTSDADLLRQLPFKQFEYVNVTFVKENEDTFIPFSVLRPDDPDNVRWIDITPSSVYTDPGTGTGDLPPTRSNTSPGWPFIYRSGGPNRRLFPPTGLWLRCSRPDYTTRLLLFVERA